MCRPCDGLGCRELSPLSGNQKAIPRKTLFEKMRNFPNARCDDSFAEKKDTRKGNGGKEQLKTRDHT